MRASIIFVILLGISSWVGCGEEKVPQKTQVAITASVETVHEASKVKAKGEEKAESPRKQAEKSTTTQPKSAVIVVKEVGFATPESVLYDPQTDQYLVSNINGSPLATDGNGFISRIKANGEVDILKWVDGAKPGVTLNAPKGMAIVGGLLYVADIDHIRKFHAKTGAPAGEIKISGATFLNDMVKGAHGSAYVSDSGLKMGEKGLEPSETDAVYRLAGDGTVTTLAKGVALGRPNGLCMVGETLYVVTFGSGELFILGEDGKKRDAIKLPKGSLDGVIQSHDGHLVISSWGGKALFKGPPAGPFKEAATNLEAPADIGWDSKRHRVLVPRFNDNTVEIHSL